MSRGFESHRLRQRQHPAGCCFLFLQQTMQGLQGGIRTARARRFASRRAATVLRTCCKGAGESHRLRQRQHPAGCCFLFLQQTMQGLQGGIRTARAWRFASRRAKMPRWGIFRARENPTVCAKHRHSISHWVVIFYCHFVKSPYFSYKHLPFIFK